MKTKSKKVVSEVRQNTKNVSRTNRRPVTKTKSDRLFMWNLPLRELMKITTITELEEVMTKAGNSWNPYRYCARSSANLKVAQEAFMKLNNAELQSFYRSIPEMIRHMLKMQDSLVERGPGNFFGTITAIYWAGHSIALNKIADALAEESHKCG